MGKRKKREKGVTYRSLEDAAQALLHSDDAKSRTEKFAAKEHAEEAKYWQARKAGHVPDLSDLSDDDDQQWRDEAAFINQTRADQKAASAAAALRAQTERQTQLLTEQDKINTHVFSQRIATIREEQQARQEIANQMAATKLVQKTQAKPATPHGLFQPPLSREAQRAAETKRRLAQFEKRREQTLFNANTTQQHVDPNSALPAQEAQKQAEPSQPSTDTRVWFNPTRAFW